MPRNNKRNFKNRKQNKRSKRSNGNSLIARCTKSVSMPEMYRLFEVSELFSMQGTDGVFSTSLIANSLFNPGGTNFNAQPVGFNEYMALYTKYRVLKCSLKMQCVNNGDATVNGVWIVTYPSVVSTSLAGSVATATCQPKSKSRFLGNYQGMGITMLRNECTSHIAFGESAMLDENFSGDFGSSPAYKWYWIIQQFSVGSDDVNIQVLIKMQFWTKLYARIPLLLDTPSLLTAKADTNLFISERLINSKAIIDNEAKKDL